MSEKQSEIDQIHLPEKEDFYLTDDQLREKYPLWADEIIKRVNYPVHRVLPESKIGDSEPLVPFSRSSETILKESMALDQDAVDGLLPGYILTPIGTGSPRTDRFMWGDLVKVEGKVINSGLNAVIVKIPVTFPGETEQHVCLRGEDIERIELVGYHFPKMGGAIRPAIFDHKALLRKYMQLVSLMEGTCFVNGSEADVFLSPAEIEYLKQIEKEISA